MKRKICTECADRSCKTCKARDRRLELYYQNHERKKESALNYYNNNKEKIRIKQKLSPKTKIFRDTANAKSHLVFRNIIEPYKNKPCADCNQNFPMCVMQFDHTRGIKKFDISRGKGKNKSILLEEIEKCDVVCSNCHAIRTCERDKKRKHSLRCCKSQNISFDDKETLNDN